MSTDNEDNNKPRSWLHGGSLQTPGDDEGDHIVKPGTGEMKFGSPVGYIVERFATASSQRIFDLNVPESERVDLRSEARAFIKRAKRLMRKRGGEAIIRMAMKDEKTSFDDIGLDIRGLTVTQARIALEQYFEKRQGFRGFWLGVLATVLADLAIRGLTGS